MTNVTMSNFEREVLQPVEGEVVLVDFGATWCGPCKKLEPILHALASQRPGEVKLVKVDIDDAPELAARFNVRSVPTVLAFRKGELIGKRVGLTRRESLAELLEQPTR